MTADKPSTSTGPDLAPPLLFLPPTGDAWADDWQVGSAATDDLGEPGPHPCRGPEPDDSRRLFWFRWIVGHQLSFLVWRSMSDMIPDDGAEPPSPSVEAELARCVDAYTALLVYTSTVPRALYHSEIRARMALQHPAFSGTWAPDYRPVARLLRGRSPWLTDPACADLATAVERNREVHDHIADHLVPDGRSLLRHASDTAGAALQDKWDLFDNFFMTIRRPTSRNDALAQFSHRIGDAGLDLAQNGLYPRVGGCHHPVLGDDADPATARLAANVPAVLRRVLRSARRPSQGLP